MKFQIGLVGLGVMGRNLALNMERNGFSVCAFDIDEQQRQKAQEAFSNKKMSVVTSFNDLLFALERPRKIMMMVPAGKAVDAVIDALSPLLQSGDLLIDGGNSYFLDTERRYKQLKGKGILYIGTGVSGGEEGALHGPSLMPGGNPQAWPLIEDLFSAIAAKTEDGAPCATWIGEGGAGHFVKMVHNGIEYGDMQMICESYFLMKQLLQMPAQEMSAVFQKWNQGELDSYLIQITADILSKTNPETGQP
ncbi:MAG TPA: NADP-dependent phosphogluconate dehydrogenase, partial [Caldithrix abyssi]|nr:NADP-dependent phosphogluconate dehydrogenase [Caldithrix abyssi]